MCRKEKRERESGVRTKCMFYIDIYVHIYIIFYLPFPCTLLYPLQLLLRVLSPSSRLDYLYSENSQKHIFCYVFLSDLSDGVVLIWKICLIFMKKKKEKQIKKEKKNK